MTNRIKLSVPLDPRKATVELNGAPLEGVVALRFSADAGSGPTRVHITVVAEVTVDGEFRSKEVLVVRGRAGDADQE